MDGCSDPEIHRLRLEILTAFSTPSAEVIVGEINSYLRKLPSHKPSLWGSIMDPNEDEREWLVAAVQTNLSEEYLRRLSLSFIRVEIGIKILPLMMTCPTRYSWQLGRGVFDCGLGTTGAKVDRYGRHILEVGSRLQIEAVKHYVEFCAGYFDEVAIVSWREFWSSVTTD